ncbi:MAG: DEAD/DEAH box helicase, partial [SAR324 cluster bacterium]|nr:DEAD/DEAH box helicase [SAR324 cluster bacterium]
QALTWYKEGRIEKIIEYCKQDVEVTRLIHEHALQHGQISYDSRGGVKTVALSWSIEAPAPQASEQMSLFD